MVCFFFPSKSNDNSIPCKNVVMEDNESKYVHFIRRLSNLEDVPLALKHHQMTKLGAIRFCGRMGEGMECYCHVTNDRFPKKNLIHTKESFPIVSFKFAFFSVPNPGFFLLSSVASFCVKRFPELFKHV